MGAYKSVVSVGKTGPASEPVVLSGPSKGRFLYVCRGMNHRRKGIEVKEEKKKNEIRMKLEALRK